VSYRSISYYVIIHDNRVHPNTETTSYCISQTTNSVVRQNQTHATTHNICGLCVPRRRFPVVSLSLRLKRESELQAVSCVLTQETDPYLIWNAAAPPLLLPSLFVGGVHLGVWGVVLVVCVCRCRGCCSLSVCVCVCDLLICLTRVTTWPVVGCKIPRKENSPIFDFFSRPRLPVSPGSPELDPMIDQTKRPG